MSRIQEKNYKGRGRRGGSETVGGGEGCGWWFPPLRSQFYRTRGRGGHALSEQRTDAWGIPNNVPVVVRLCNEPASCTNSSPLDPLPTSTVFHVGGRSALPSRCVVRGAPRCIIAPDTTLRATDLTRTTQRCRWGARQATHITGTFPF